MVRLIVVFIAALCAAVSSSYGQERIAIANTELTPIAITGSAGNRINVAFMSEGYGNSKAQFIADANLTHSGLFDIEPIKNYKAYFNFASVWADYADAKLAFSDALDVGDLSDQLVGRYFPKERSIALVSVNSSVKGGGSGGGQGYLIGSAALYGSFVDQPARLSPGADIGYVRAFAHEFGHGFIYSGEEFVGKNISLGDREPRDGEIGYVNTTMGTSRDKIRWKHWIDPGTPIPTPNDSAYKDVVGLFPGAAGRSSGWYRPALTCIMRSTSQPFCTVCREAIVKQIYKYVTPIDSSWVNVGETVTIFNIKLINPEPNTLAVSWQIDGVEYDYASRANSFRVSEDLLPYGAHTVKVVVRDTTSFVRDDPQNLLVKTMEWPVVNSPKPDFNRDGAVNMADFFLFADAFGEKSVARSAFEKFDLDLNGAIGFPDFFLFADAFTSASK